MRVTEKGQVTIPIEVREQLGLLPGDEVEFRVEGGAAMLTRGHGTPSRGQRMVNLLLGSGDVEMTTDEVMELTRGE